MVDTFIPIRIGFPHNPLSCTITQELFWATVYPFKIYKEEEEGNRWDKSVGKIW